MQNINTVFSHVNNDLQTVNDWFKANKITLNVGKSNYMLFTKSRFNLNDIPPLIIGQDEIHKSKEVKFLGITLDQNLDWRAHTDFCLNRIASGTYAINSVKRIFPRKQLITLYNSLVLPYLTYGLILWGRTQKNILQKLRIAQNKTIRRISNANYNTSAGPLYKTLGLMSLDDLYSYELTKFMYQNARSLLPSPLLALFITNTDIHGHNTRHRLDAHVTHRRTKLASQSFTHQGPEIWLSVPQRIKDATSFASFKKLLKLNIVSK